MIPWKLIGFILLLVIISFFVGFNIETKIDIRYWFGDNGVAEDVPLLISFIGVYTLGVLSSFPFLLSLKNKRKSIKEEEEVSIPTEKSKDAKERKPLFRKKKKEDNEEVSDEDNKDS